MKKTANMATLLLLLVTTFLVACRSSAVSETSDPVSSEKKTVTVGFSQLGAESDWRGANTESMLSALSAENGYSLIYENGQQKQSYQITELRSFIQQEVDYILLAPVTESAWRIPTAAEAD